MRGRWGGRGGVARGKYCVISSSLNLMAITFSPLRDLNTLLSFSQHSFPHGWNAGNINLPGFCKDGRLYTQVLTQCVPSNQVVLVLMFQMEILPILSHFKQMTPASSFPLLMVIFFAYGEKKSIEIWKHSYICDSGSSRHWVTSLHVYHQHSHILHATPVSELRVNGKQYSRRTYNLWR